MWYFAEESLCFLLTFFLCQNAQVRFFHITLLFISYFGSSLTASDFSRLLTAVNIKGVFNTSNETKYDKDAPDGTEKWRKANF